MRIGIDVRMIFKFPTGIGNYSKDLIGELFKLDQENEYILIGNEEQIGLTGVGRPLADLHENVTFQLIRSKANQPLQHLSLFFELSNLALDVFYTTPWGATLSIPCPYVVTIHDLIYHHYPEFGSWKSRLYELFLEKVIAQRAKYVITISEFVKQDIKQILRVEESKIINASEDVSSDYRVIEDDLFINNVLKKYGLIDEIATPTSSTRNDNGSKKREPFPYFVYLGNQRPHKNLVGLLKAFEIFKNTLSLQSSSPTTPSRMAGHPSYDKEGKVKLVIIGGVDAKGRDQDTLRIKEQIEKMKFKDDVMLLGKVFDNNEVAAIYQSAIAMVHPSLHEGFGMTPLEAMRCGCPVIASNVTSMPEVVGDAGILVNPLDESAIAKAMNEIYVNVELRKDLQKKSLKRSMLFSWEKTARILLDVFEKLKK